MATLSTQHPGRPLQSVGGIEALSLCSSSPGVKGFYAPHRLERPATVAEEKLWVNLMEHHHEFETCPVEDWFSETLKSLVKFGGDIRWSAELRYQLGKLHLVVHRMTDEFLSISHPIVLPACVHANTPGQRELKVFLAKLRQLGYSHRIEDWYRLAKIMVALALKTGDEYRPEAPHRICSREWTDICSDIQR